MAIEDFTTYTELDPLGEISKTPSRTTVTNLGHGAAYCYYDKDPGHFGDFEHHLEVYATSGEQDWSKYAPWSLWNDLGGFFELGAAGNTGLYLEATRWAGGGFKLGIVEYHGGSKTEDWYTASWSTLYYLTIERSGTALTCKIYSDAARTDLLATLSVTCSADTLRYIYSAQSYGGADGWHGMWGYTQNLDLQEVVLKPYGFVV